jgi:hypothetical protein
MDKPLDISSRPHQAFAADPGLFGDPAQAELAFVSGLAVCYNEGMDGHPDREKLGSTLALRCETTIPDNSWNRGSPQFGVAVFGVEVNKCFVACIGPIGKGRQAAPRGGLP